MSSLYDLSTNTFVIAMQILLWQSQGPRESWGRYLLIKRLSGNPTTYPPDFVLPPDARGHEFAKL